MTDAAIPPNAAQARELKQSAAGEIHAHQVEMRQSSAKSITAHNVSMKESGCGKAQADKIEVTEGGIGMARAVSVEMREGGVGVVFTEEASLQESSAGVLLADTVQGDVRASLVLTGQMQGNVHTALSTPQAALLGAVGGIFIGLTLWLMRFLNRDEA